MASADLKMPLATSNTIENNTPGDDDVLMEPEANAEVGVTMSGVRDAVKHARNGSSSPLSNGFSSQLSDAQGMEENVDDDDDEDASGEDDDQVADEPPIEPDLNGDEDAEGEVDDDATSSTVPLTPEATTPEAEVEAEDDAAKNLPSAQQTGNAMLAEDRVVSGSELTSEDASEDEDEEDDEDGEDGNISERDDDDISVDEGSDGDVEDERVDSRLNSRNADDDVEMETPRSTASPTPQSIPLPTTSNASPSTSTPPLKLRKPSIMASSFAAPAVDRDAEGLAGVDEEEEESDLSDNESDGGKKSGKNGKGANAGKQVSVDDDDDELSEVEEEDAKDDEGDGVTARRLSSASKGKSGEASGVDGDGDNSDMDEDEAPRGGRSGSASPSKASGIATPPPAGINAPSYHLRGDPFNQSIAPTAPTAEALSALVAIEVKFAQLRDQLYIERMNEFAQEEAVIVKGEHPSVRYLHNILEERKDNLLRLAELRLKQSELEINRVRVADRKAVISWWTNARETLYTEHYEQNARKKRKIEKDKLELDGGKPSIPVTPKPLPPKDPLVAERILRGYDWTRGPVIAGGLPGSEANEDLARMGLRRPPVIYQQMQQPQHHYGMAPQPQMVYVDAPPSRQVAQNQMGGAYHPNEDVVGIDNPNGVIYDSMGRVVNGHHHHHHHHAGPHPATSSSAATVPAPAASAPQPSHGGVPILGRPRYGHAATGVHINPPAAPRREGRTVPTSTLDPFDSSRRRDREREDYGSSGKSRRMETNGGSMHELDEAAAKRRKVADGMGNGSGSRHYGQYGSGTDYGSSAGGGGTRSIMDAKVSGDPTRRSDSSNRPKSQHPSSSMANGPSYGSSLSNGPVSSFGIGGQPSRWPFGLYSGSPSGGSAATGGAGAPGTNAMNGLRMADPVGGRSGRMLGSLGGGMRE